MLTATNITNLDNLQNQRHSSQVSILTEDLLFLDIGIQL